MIAKVSGSIAAMSPGTSLRDCDICPEMVVIPPGRYTMGSPENEAGRYADGREGPQHVVGIPQQFAVGKYEVTRGQFARFLSEGGYSASGGCFVGTMGFLGGVTWEYDASKDWRNPGFPQTDNDPVVCVDWNEAKAYTQWLARQSGKSYRLLTEAEWEYAARAGNQASRFWGDNANDACRYANVGDASRKGGLLILFVHECDDGRAYTAPVGSYQPNAFGLYDMIGNVWEWTEDCWNAKYAAAPSDGSPRTSGNCGQRVLRGGSWFDSAAFARSAMRIGYSVGTRYHFLGFRVARTQ